MEEGEGARGFGREVVAETLVVEVTAITIKHFIDSNNLYQAAKSTKSVEDRRLRLGIVQIQECVKESKVKIVWVKADKMLADCLTKRGGKTEGLMDVITSGILPSIKKHDNEAGVHMMVIEEEKENEYENE